MMQILLMSNKNKQFCEPYFRGIHLHFCQIMTVELSSFQLKEKCDTVELKL